MGVTLYYQGALHKPADVHNLVTEVVDIAKAKHWKYHVLDDPWDTPVDVRLEHTDNGARFTGNAGLKGVMLSIHPECERVHLLFDKEGVLRTVMNMIEPPEKRDAFGFTKTQFAGIDVHIEVVKLLEYIGKTYMREWELNDESGFLQHRDREKASAIFHKIGDMINAVEEAFGTIEIPEELTREDTKEFISKVEKRLKTFLPGVEIHAVRLDEEE